MSFVNLPGSLQALIQDITNRLLRLEASRFTVPNVSSDPTTFVNGDMWLNVTTNQLKVVDNTGTKRIISWT